ncbi:putative glycogen synthase kinase-3 alpha [Trypanosoma rangeli]|uniref:Putative glycogen synthase kinase-3 alpha n=1 Tax=Trypanosoma rangeli TaxID=5698 RepID=A0A3R7NAU1_TRYRA|nr:putative glycogen synthase kinase-3 alpha [Trypanosoma rangeli]RNE99696.1 putative glycogen synthase kinase-3 alpha [Trypanosoma rangeli]|eukprot:RNE99696.1 putative glycogen synthase kinase-3 alpha [Trypanosoma rangeli]
MPGGARPASATPIVLSVAASQQHPDGTDRNNGTGNQATYELLHVLGKGSFGVVMMARVRETGNTVAVKKVLFDGRLHNRELLLLRDHLGPNSVSEQPVLASPDNSGTETVKNDHHSTNNLALKAGTPPIGDATPTPTIVPHHPSIVRLLDHFTASGPNGEQYLYIVMDYLPLDIHQLHNMYVRQKQQRMPIMLVKITMFQVARALAFLHSRGICHRDVKPSNLLIDPETGVLKLCDFGSAKVMQPPGVNGPREKNVSYICSRYYRAPELLLGSLYYHFHIDLWAAGCVLAELLCGEVLFKGGSTVDQMAEIFKVLGAPSRQELFALNPQSAEALLHASGADLEVPPASAASAATSSDYLQRYHALRIKALQWQNVLPPNTAPAAVSLVGELLRYTPAERLSAAEVLEHSFFDDIFAEDACLPSGAPLPVSMFEVTAEEMETLPHWLLERMASAEAFARRRLAEAGDDGKNMPQK